MTGAFFTLANGALFVLPKVSQAIKKLIEPITSSTTGRVHLDHKQNQNSKQSFERFSPKPQKTKTEHRDSSAKKVVTFPIQQHPLIQKGLSQAFLQLVEIFKNQKTSFYQWLGLSAYTKGNKKKREKGKFKKGTILDHRIY